MFYHVKELQFDARVSGPYPRFASLLLSGSAAPRASSPPPCANSCRRSRRASHLEIVGATITMLLNGVSGELKIAGERSDLMRLLRSPTQKEEMIHQAMVSPQFLMLSGGGPTLTNSQGVPRSGTYIEAATSRWICAPASPPSRAPRSSMST